MEPNYSRHALICTSCWSITRGVTLAFQSPSVCFEICDNQSQLPFVTACSVWYAGKKAWPIAMEEFPCFQLKNLLLCSLTSLHTNDNNCVREYTCVFVPACVYVCVPSMSRHLQLMNVFMCVWQHLVAAQSQREIKQSVNYLERAPVAVTEKRRPNIQDQILFSVCHIMRQLHQAQTTHTKWSNTGHWSGATLKLLHDWSTEHIRELSAQDMFLYRLFAALEWNRETVKHCRVYALPYL